MKKTIWLITLILMLVSCYKMPDEPESLKDEYLNVADFIAFYHHHRIDTGKLKIKGMVERESYNKFLMGLKQRTDTSVVDTSPYNDTTLYFYIYDPAYGYKYGIKVRLCSCVDIKDDLFSFFYRHSENKYAYIYSKNVNEFYHGFFNLPSYYFDLSDTTEINFKNQI